MGPIPQLKAGKWGAWKDEWGPCGIYPGQAAFQRKATAEQQPQADPASEQNSHHLNKKKKKCPCQSHTYFQDRPLFDNNSIIALHGFAIFWGNSFKDEYSICQAA